MIEQLEIPTKKEYNNFMGVGLLFHPDLIRGTELAKNIRQYL